MVRGNLAERIKNPAIKGGSKFPDYILYFRTNLPLSVIEVKKNIYSVGYGMQQALLYAEMLDVPFAISTNGDAMIERGLPIL